MTVDLGLKEIFKANLLAKVGPEVCGVAHAQALQLHFWVRLLAVAEEGIEQCHVTYCARDHSCKERAYQDTTIMRTLSAAQGPG